MRERRAIEFVSEQAIHLAVGVVQGLVAAEREGLVKCVEGLVCDVVAMPLPRQPVGEQCLLDIGIVAPILMVAEVRIAERVSCVKISFCPTVLIALPFPFSRPPTRPFPCPYNFVAVNPAKFHPRGAGVHRLPF